MRAVLVLFAVSSMLVGASACKETGSCMSGTLGDGSKLCVNYHDGDQAQSFKKVCPGLMKGTWSKDACDTTGTLGGCGKANGKSEMWVFPSDAHKTTDDVKTFCEEKGGAFLPPPAAAHK
jgi:hypothetical protein